MLHFKNQNNGHMILIFPPRKPKKLFLSPVIFYLKGHTSNEVVVNLIKNCKTIHFLFAIKTTSRSFHAFFTEF